MFYYFVWVRSEQYRSNEPLTYSAGLQLGVGALVEVSLRDKLVVGVVFKETTKPSFPTKSINKALPLPPLPVSIMELALWLQRYYPAPIGVIMQQFLPAKLPQHHIEAIEAALVTGKLDISASTQPPLTQQQQQALHEITQPDTYLLHGRTGSGKSRIYIELAKRSFGENKSSLVLVPEIGLTSQLAAGFEQAFPGKVVILHSRLTGKDRSLAWMRILQSNEPLLVVGARSALFCPLRRLGLIVVDEEHDQAYKQEQAPYYNAIRVASKLREIHGCVLVLGSATPAVHDYYLAQAAKKPVLRLDQLAIPSDHRQNITVVDLKDHAQFKRSAHISRALAQAIEASLARGEQALLYLNRRGTARVTLCGNCGWQALCPHCDLPLTFHADLFTLQCHICGYRQTAPTACPVCGNPSIEFRSFGTKAVAREAQMLFPEARIMRIDSDIAASESLERQWNEIASGSTDILVGTQLLAKGLDLPRLSTLGVIAADTSLFLPDYTARERTYQLLAQVFGRVGRGHTSSTIIVQTYQPESKLLQAALHDEWDIFYNEELAERRQYSFPPFTHILKVSCQRATAVSAEKALRKYKSLLLSAHKNITVEDPAPAFHERAGNQYRWQLVVKSRSRASLLEAIKLLPKDWSYDIDPSDLL